MTKKIYPDYILVIMSIHYFHVNRFPHHQIHHCFKTCYSHYPNFQQPKNEVVSLGKVSFTTRTNLELT